MTSFRNPDFTFRYSHSNDVYVDGNYIKCYTGNTTGNPGGTFYNINVSYNVKPSTSGNSLQTDVSNFDDTEAKQYVIGTVYRRNSQWIFFQYPYNVLSSSLLYGGSMDVETTKTYLPEDQEESVS